MSQRVTRPLCEIKQLLKKDIDAYVANVDKPRFVCEKCGRVANRKKLLCRPIKIKKLKRS